MPALILCGKPSVGKSTFCDILKCRAKELVIMAMQEGDGSNDESQKQPRAEIDNVIIISESSACPDRTKRECYQDSHAEKVMRGALKSEFDRIDNRRKNLILLDSSNYIKGYRYELYCISKAASDRHGVVWVQNSENTAKQWNSARCDSENRDGFEEETLKALNYRFEPPNEKNRWDKPLFIVDEATISDNDARSKKADEILHSFFFETEALQKGMSTAKIIPTETNVLHDVDKITQRICTVIQEAQNSLPPGGTAKISVPCEQESIDVTFSRTLHLPELRRMRRQFIKWIAGHPPEDCSQRGVASYFCQYLQQNA